MILSAVATTPKGLAAHHQIGLAVRGTPENTLRFQPFRGFGVVPHTERVSLLPAAASASAQGDPGSDDAGDTPSWGPAGLRFTFRRVTGNSPASVPAVADATETATMALVLAPGSPDGGPTAKEAGSPEKRFHLNFERTRSVRVIHRGPEYRAESTPLNTPGPSAPGLAGIGPLSPRQSRDGEVEQNPRGMPLGPEYSFGVLFIFDTGGFWRVRWY
jgi:hypothetical protein